MKITKSKALEMIKTSNKKKFEVEFLKKDGTMRHMVAKYGVSRGVTGSGMKYKPEDFGYVTVWDDEVNAYREVNMNTVQRLIMDNKEYEVK